jgi:hypothetical protein
MTTLKQNKIISYKINTSPEKYFNQLVEILKVFPPFINLRKRQREVFAEILYQFYLCRSENEDIRQRIVFDYKTKEEIARKLNITKGNLYNIYKELRQQNLLTKDGINKRYLYEFLQFGGITFKFEQEGGIKQEVQGN